jgi:hypothetical protein
MGSMVEINKKTRYPKKPGFPKRKRLNELLGEVLLAMDIEKFVVFYAKP